MDWNPAADEDQLLRITVKFATGLAPAVSGSRWFRDAERNDIQGELTGWPVGPVFTPGMASDQTARRVGRGFLFAIPVIANIIANIGGAGGSPFGSGAGSGKPEEPENEVDDFPVMWAAPGTLARTVPWELDPGRSPEGYVTDLVLTSRRLLFLDEVGVLAEFPRESIAGARQMEFSRISADMRLTFVDDSWIRLFTGNPTNAERLAGILSGSVQAVPERALTEAQRERVSRFMANLRGAVQPPVFTRYPSGIVRVEVCLRSKGGKDLVDVTGILMDDEGEPSPPKPGDL
ncbi:hypothetical protein ACKI1I_34325 [Streptomyces turgidiscabies]|uniref:Uncharacterized protein n=1 Tax=Streptomyces turgidiscabies (strain Car8) TaxID=698760 RepID=L7FBX8_STRT8|nr:MULTISPECIES: hypothetical protein [Streptomyces]ELP68772.1 hypothetical protein STRTUCAR8_04463 [Streptomyces turgidiscabies Car8]MDX3495849.1 hypothetical protein [Streptomyces turgidiscabies]GAQ72664.1 hypothetical protein T45_04418 [Streptomyces turgidiscabies]